MLARPEVGTSEPQFDPEELGLGDRQPMWSDFAGTSEGGNAGYSVVRLPVSADPSERLASRAAARRRATAAGAQRTVTPQVEQMGFLP